jgi:PAS domain S-box-containing protein
LVSLPKYLWRVLLVSLAYFVTGRLGLATPFTSGNISPVWPASGIAVACILIYGYRVWPAIFLGAFFTNFLSSIPHTAALGLGIGNTLEAIAAAFLVQKITNFDISLSRLRDVLALIGFGAITATIVGATVGVAVLYATGVSPWSGIGNAWLVYWLGDAMGVLLVAPLILALRTVNNPLTASRLAELLGLVAALTCAAFFVFLEHRWIAIKLDVLAFAVFPFVMWAAIRFGVAGCAFTIAIVATIATVTTAYGSGPFAHYSPFIDASLLQIFFFVLSTSGLTLAAALSEREHLERIRLAQEARVHLAAIVESSDDAILSKDLDGIIRTWNGGAERIFGYSAQEIIGKPVLTIIPAERHDEELQVLWKLQNGERIEHLETIRKKKSGELINVSVTISPVRDDKGRIVGCAKIARDITERKKTEEALLTSEKLASVGRMAATIAHEINNPLEAVVNLIYLARKYPGVPAEIGALLGTADDELSRVSHIVKQTLGFYRETTAPSHFRVTDVVSGMLLVYGSKIANRKIHTQVEVPEDIGIETVLGEFRQVIANIFQNAVEAVPFGGNIHIRVSSVTREGVNAVRVTIADDGPGIDHTDLRRIFDPFFTTKKNLGTGLGLWVSKGIIEKHHGNLRVRSNTDPSNSWTVFSVLWPSATASGSSSTNRLSRHQQA